MSHTVSYSLGEQQSRPYELPSYDPSQYYRPHTTFQDSSASWDTSNASYNQGSTTAGPPNNIAPAFRPTPAQSHHSQYSQYQPIPPPPPGPPPLSNAVARMHSVIREIAVPPSNDLDSTHGSHSQQSMPLSFRQLPRTHAPLPLRSRELAFTAPKVPLYIGTQAERDVYIPPAPKTANPIRQRKPAPLNIQLAENIITKQTNMPAKTAPIRTVPAIGSYLPSRPRGADIQPLQYPKTAGLPPLAIATFGTTTPSSRRLSLSPLDTQLTPASRRSIIVDFVLSPSLIPQVSQAKSPFSTTRSESSSTPPWSPETPRAMFFDPAIVASDTTPPLQPISRLNKRSTFIEEDVQSATPKDTAPPRGRMLGVQHSRARSMSPPSSAYPKDSAFSWETADLEVRGFATDDDLYCMTPVEVQQMMEDEKYRPAQMGFNPRQMILGSYFGR